LMSSAVQSSLICLGASALAFRPTFSAWVFNASDRSIFSSSPKMSLVFLSSACAAIFSFLELSSSFTGVIPVLDNILIYSLVKLFPYIFFLLFIYSLVSILVIVSLIDGSRLLFAFVRYPECAPVGAVRRSCLTGTFLRRLAVGVAYGQPAPEGCPPTKKPAGGGFRGLWTSVLLDVTGPSDTCLSLFFFFFFNRFRWVRFCWFLRRFSLCYEAEFHGLVYIFLIVYEFHELLRIVLESCPCFCGQLCE